MRSTTGLCAALLLIACSRGSDREKETTNPPAADATQAADMKAAIASGVAGIIVDHGTSPTMCPLINQATDAGIAVVVYDVKVADCAPKAVETRQNDTHLAALL